MTDSEILSDIRGTLKEIHSDITDVKTEVVELRTIQTIQTTTNETRLRKLEKGVEGNGQPGLKVRVDRLERVAHWSGKLLWVLVPTIIGLIALGIRYSLS